MKRLKQINKGWIVAGFVILVLAFLSRLVMLGAHPLHHDEGMLSYFAWKLATEGSYTYTPQIHAPVLFYVQAILFKIFGAAQRAGLCPAGEGNNIVRLGPAIFGIILVAVPLFFRKSLGKAQAIAISILILTSPILLYYSRFLVHSSIVLLFWFLFILFLKQFLTKPKIFPLLGAIVFFVLGFATSETSYIFTAVLIAFIPIFYIFSRTKFKLYFHQTKKYFAENPYDLLSAVILFVLVWVASFSVFFTNIQSFLVSLPNPFDKATALGFWLAQHKTHLGNQKWYYYFTLLAVYEPALIVAGVLAIIDSIKKRKVFYLFLSWWTVAMLAGIAIAGEKFPWLILPALLPLVVLSGYYIGGGWKKFKLLSKVFFIVILLFTAFNAYRLCFLNPADTRELAVYVQTPQNYEQIISKINGICPDKKDTTCVAIDSNISWPNSWLFRYNGTLVGPSGYVPAKTTKVILMGTDKADQAQIPENYIHSQVKLREWWVPTECKKLSCAKQFFNYFIYRKIWNDKGGFDIYLYEKK